MTKANITKLTQEELMTGLLNMVQDLTYRVIELENNAQHKPKQRDLKEWQVKAIAMKATGSSVNAIVDMAPVGRQAVSTFLNKPETLIAIASAQE